MTDRKSIRSELPTIAILTCAAFLYRLLLVLRIERIVWGDEPFYLWLGRNWLTGQGYTFTGYHDVHHTPLYPFLSGIFYLITGNMEVASNILYVIFGALLVAPIYLIGYEMYGRRVGILSAVLVSVWPALTISILHWGTLTEPPYFFFIYSGIYCSLLALRGRGSPPYFLAGAFLALAYLTRPEAIGYLVAVFVIIAAVRLCERKLLTRRALAGLGLIMLGYMLLFFPYAFYVRQNTGEWMISEKAGVTYVTSKSLAYGDTVTFDKMTWGLDRAGTEVYFFSPESYNVSIIDVVRDDPYDFVKLVYVNIRRFVDSLLSLRLFPYWLVPLVAVGWLKRPWTAERLKAEVYLLGAISPVLGFLIFFIQDRYIVALLPGLIIWAANGLNEVMDWLAATMQRILPYVNKQSRAFAVVTILPALALLAYLAFSAPAVNQASLSGSWRPEHKSIGLWLRDHTPPGGTLMSRYPAMAFYADKRWIPTPNAPLADVLHYARLKNANYWIIDERETVKLRPQFAPLLLAQPSADLLPIHVDTATSEKQVIYQIVAK